jgi:pimeloyl-ACP methyl ester carboxylesterase
VNRRAGYGLLGIHSVHRGSATKPIWILLLGCSNGEDSASIPDPRDTDTATATSLYPDLEIIDLGIDCGANSNDDKVCQTLQVTCEGLDPITAHLRISEATSGSPFLGTLVTGSGGGGNSWWNSGSDDAVQFLRDAGYRVVERRWPTPWMAGEAGLRKTACRYASLLKWVAQTVAPEGPICAVGNSVGATEVGTLLTARSEWTLLSGAVLQSGPPFTRLDLACLPNIDPEWPDACENSFDEFGVCSEGTRECTVYEDESSEIADLIDLAFPGTPCVDQDLDALAEFQAESTWPPGALPGSLPIPTAVLVGAKDCVEAVPFALLFAELAGIEARSIEGANHKPQASQEGLSALLTALQENCPAP